jgi:hypothetical protein
MLMFTAIVDILAANASLYFAYWDASPACIIKAGCCETTWAA